MKYDKEIIGKRIRAARRNLTRKEFELKTGISENTIKDLESGKKLPRIETLVEICEKTNCEIGYLFGEFEKPTLDLSFICEKTGLQANSIETIMHEEESRRRLLSKVKELGGKNCRHSELLELINIIAAEDEYGLIEGIREHFRDKFQVLQLESDPDFPIYEKAYHDALAEKVSWEYSDKGAFESAEQKEIFLSNVGEAFYPIIKMHSEELVDFLMNQSEDVFPDKVELGKILDRLSSNEEQIANEVQNKKDRAVSLYELFEKRKHLEKDEMALAIKFIKTLHKLESKMIRNEGE